MAYNINRIYEWPRGIRYVVIGVVAFAVFYVGYRWDISALKNSLATSQAQEVDLKLQQEKLLQKERDLTQALTAFPKLKTLRDQWQQTLVTHQQLPDVLNTILKISSTEQLYVNLFNPGKEVQEGDYYKLPIHVIVVGKYQQISSFISEIANLHVTVAVGDFILSNENKNDMLGAKLAAQAAAQHLLTAEMILLIYRPAEGTAKHG